MIDTGDVSQAAQCLHGADRLLFERQNEMLFKPIHAAAQRNQVAILDLLLKAGCPVDCRRCVVFLRLVRL